MRAQLDRRTQSRVARLRITTRRNVSVLHTRYIPALRTIALVLALAESWELSIPWVLLRLASCSGKPGTWLDRDADFPE